MTGYSTDEDNEELADYEEENEAMPIVQLVDDDQYDQMYFDKLKFDTFRQKMIPSDMAFPETALAHIQATLTAKGDRIDSGLRPQEIDEVMKDLSDKWMDMGFLAKNMFPEDEVMRRNSFNVLHHSWFTNYVEHTASGCYKIRETDENREVLEYMKEGASYAASKKQYDDANRNQENERPANRARFMHGCNFLCSLVGITCDMEMLDDVEWQQVQKTYLEMVALYESKASQSIRLSKQKQNLVQLFGAYQKVLKLDDHKILNGGLIKYITGRRKAKDALAEPMFANIGMKTTSVSGGFSVFIVDDQKTYTAEDIERTLNSSNRPITRQALQISKKEAELIRKQEERDARKSTYVPKYANRGIPENAIPEISSLSRPKPTPFTRTDWDGTNDDADDDELQSISGLAPQANKMVHKSESKTPAASMTPEPLANHSESDDDDFSSAGEMDGNKDNMYSDDEDDRQRRKKKSLKTTSKTKDSKEDANKVDNSQQKPESHTALKKYTPFATTHYSDEDDDEEISEPDEEHEKITNDDENTGSNKRISIYEEEIFGLDEKSHENVSKDLRFLIHRNVPGELDSVTLGSPASSSVRLTHSQQPVTSFHKHSESPAMMNDNNGLVHPSRPHASYEILPNQNTPKERENRIAREHQVQHEEVRMREKTHKIKEEEFERQRKTEKERLMKEFKEEEKIREAIQLKKDEELAWKIQDELDRAARGGPASLQTSIVNGKQGLESNYARRVLNSNTSGFQCNESSNLNSFESARRTPAGFHGSFDTSTLRQTEDPFHMGNISDVQYSNRSPVDRSLTHHRQESTLRESRTQMGYAPSFTGSSFTSVSQNYARGSVQCGSPFDNGKSSYSGAPGFRCNVPEDILLKIGQEGILENDEHRLIIDIPQDLELYHVDHGSLSRDRQFGHHINEKSGEYSNSGPRRAPDVCNAIDPRVNSRIHTTRIPDNYREYADYQNVHRNERDMNPKYLNGPAQGNRNAVYDHYNISHAPPANRYDVSRPGTSNSYRGGSTVQRLSPSLNPQADAFIRFIKYYMIVFVSPGTEIQWSEIVERCKKIHSTFRYHHPSEVFGVSFVDQMLKQLPHCIEVCSLNGSNEVIFAIDGRGGIASFADPRALFVEFAHSFLRAFDKPIRWIAIAENNLLLPSPDTIFATLPGGFWVDEFNDLARRMGLPIKAEKPLSQVYLSIL